jgi:hypothetical protein
MRRASALAVPLLAAVLALTACGGGSVSPESVAKAATKTAKVKSYRVTATTKLKIQKKDVTFVAKGAFDPKARRGRMNVDMSQLNLLQGPEGSPYNYGYALFVLDGSDLYMRIPFLRLTYRNLKPWLKVDLDRLSAAQGADSFLQYGAGGDPTRVLQSLGGLGKLHKEGTETVRGVSTTHYSGTINLKRARGGEQLFRLTGQRKLPVEVWIDDDGLVRRERWTQKQQIGNNRTDVQIEMELYDFGAPVVAQVPAARDVTDLTGAGGSQS